MLADSDNWTNYITVYKYYRIKSVKVTVYDVSVTPGTTVVDELYMRQPLIAAYSASSTATGALNMDKMLRNPSAAFVAADRDTQITFTP